VDVRIIAAGNAEPLDAIGDGRLRVDLYHRLSVFTIALPPLRARLTDIAPLVESFADEFRRRHGKSAARVDAAVMDVLGRHQWPGNVRELRNVIERAVILAEGDLIEVRHLPPALVDAVCNETAARTLTLPAGTTVEEAERQLIQLTLEHTSHNKAHAAALLGISAKTLYNKLQQRRDEHLSS
jgi:DNA-binding NtrC family response regulator